MPLLHRDKVYAARARLVQETLEGGTEFVFAGWGRNGTDGGFTYVGKPERDLRSLTVETPPPKNQVFLIFILDDGTIDFWTWREWSNGRPVGVSGEQLWPTI